MTARATLALLVALLLWLPLAAQAQQRQVVVKSGEHPGFSRLVLDLPPRFTWQLEPVAGGFDLVLSPAEVSFDLGQVFRLIPRTRLLAVTSEGASRLRLRTAENVQPVVFRNETGRALVIDLKEAPDVAATATTPMPGATTLAPLRAPATLRRYTPQVPPPPGLEVFWQQTAPAAARKAPDQAALRTTTPASPPDTPREAARVMPPAAAAPLLLPTLPNPRAVALEDELLRSLGRAASQGLIRLETPQFDVAEVAPPAPAAPKPPPEPAPTEEAPAPATPEVAPEDPAALERQMHIHVDTSIDRAQAEDPPLPALTNAGATCPAEETVDIGAWADDSDFALQLAERQKALLGEFDRPEPEAVARLARFYIAKGFGAEARAVLSNFPLPAREATPLRAIADIIDEGQAADPGAFAGFAECDNGAALWAVLARPRIAPGESVNTAAVLRSFSAMPLSLRELLGPGLADRLIAKGDTDSARMVRDSILRATETPGDGLRIIDARLAIDPATPGVTGALANSELTTIAESNDPRAPEALVLLVDRLLASGVTIPDTQIETAAALAFEQRDGPQGPALARAQVLGLASAGRFDESFDALQRLAGNWPKSVSRDLARELFTMLAAQKDELPFMTNFLSHRGQFSAADPPPALRLQVARRLLDAGLADEATASLGVAVANSPEGQLIAAQAALLAQDGRTAIAILAGRDDAAAARLQAEAHAQLGDFNAAAEAYRRAGDPEAAAAAAWRAGDWAQAQDGASEAQRSVIGLGLPGTSPAPAPAEAPQPSLAASRQLLQDSEAARNAWQALISGAPASNP